MESAVCTLFEGNYHHGVAALVNSLYNCGFRGSVYAGYRGNIPNWTSRAIPNEKLQWPGCSTLRVGEGVQLHFLPLGTNYHLTNYKPDFMISLWNGPAAGADALLYFDPDIVVVAPWSFFCYWLDCGIALCEDVNSPLAANHPRRIAWRKYFGSQGIQLRFKDTIYANGGFVGVMKSERDFLRVWQNIQEKMVPLIGGLNRSALTGDALPMEAQGPFAPFGKTDQDALNAAVEVWERPVSFVGKEGMGFKAGTALMPHALGQPKPWRWNPLIQVLAGRPPRLVIKEYWKYVKGPIRVHSTSLIYFQLFSINVAAFIGRFYRRGNI